MVTSILMLIQHPQLFKFWFLELLQKRSSSHFNLQTSTHKGVGGAPNKKLKTFAQSSTNGAIIIASILGKSSKIELLKMEANKEIALNMIQLDCNVNTNVECQLQLAKLFARVM